MQIRGQPMQIKIVGHLPYEISHVCFYFLSHGGKIEGITTGKRRRNQDSPSKSPVFWLSLEKNEWYESCRHFWKRNGFHLSPPGDQNQKFTLFLVSLRLAILYNKVSLSLHFIMRQLNLLHRLYSFRNCMLMWIECFRENILLACLRQTQCM